MVRLIGVILVVLSSLFACGGVTVRDWWKKTVREEVKDPETQWVKSWGIPVPTYLIAALREIETLPDDRLDKHFDTWKAVYLADVTERMDREAKRISKKRFRRWQVTRVQASKAIVRQIEARLPSSLPDKKRGWIPNNTVESVSTNHNN